MNTNPKYVYIIMYDIPVEKNNKLYLQFRKSLLNLDGMFLQESIYMIQVSSKQRANIIKNELSIIAPEGFNIRGLLITNEAFEKMDIISGEMNINEKLISKKHAVIEI